MQSTSTPSSSQFYCNHSRDWSFFNMSDADSDPCNQWKELAKKKGVKQAEIVSWFYDNVSPSKFQCKGCSKELIHTNFSQSGCSNLLSHLERSHPAFRTIIETTLSQNCASNQYCPDLTSLNSQEIIDGMFYFSSFFCLPLCSNCVLTL